MSSGRVLEYIWTELSCTFEKHLYVLVFEINNIGSFMNTTKQTFYNFPCQNRHTTVQITKATWNWQDSAQAVKKEQKQICKLSRLLKCVSIINCQRSDALRRR